MAARTPAPAPASAPGAPGAVGGAGTGAGPGAGRPPEPSADELLRLDNQLCFPLYACSKEIIRRYRPLLDPLGLTYTQYICMMALWERDGQTVGQLGRRLCLDSGTLTPLLGKLEGKGYVARGRSAEDSRQVVVRLTEEGRALKARATGVPLAMACEVGLTADEAAQLKGLLGKVLRSPQEGSGDDDSCSGPADRG